LFAIVAVALFGGLIGGVGLAGGFAGPMRDEVIKDLLQVAIVGVLGAALTVAVNGLQVRRDTRRQADELMRTWMGEVITIYQKVRVSRWRLQALVAGTDGDRCVTVAVAIPRRRNLPSGWGSSAPAVVVAGSYGVEQRHLSEQGQFE
jgi:hypothetical protein